VILQKQPAHSRALAAFWVVIMDETFMREQAARCRSLAEKADPFTKKRLLDLAVRYENWLPDQPSKASGVIRLQQQLQDAPSPQRVLARPEGNPRVIVSPKVVAPSSHSRASNDSGPNLLNWRYCAVTYSPTRR